MKLVSRNVRGLNSPSKLRMIKNLIRMEKPQVFFLHETKCTVNTLGPILSKAWLSFHSVAVDTSGASGGLAISWDPRSISISDAHAAHNLIQASFHILGTNLHGLLSNVYFPQDAARKIALLDTVEFLNSTRTHPLWIMGGDFNMITNLDEKIGGRAKLEADSTHFKGFIQWSWLIDLPFANGIHTSNNKRSGS